MRAREVPQGKPDPCPHRLLLLFWAHLIRHGPHLLCIGSPQVIDYLLQTTKERMLLITSKRRILQSRGKVVELVTLLTWVV